MKEKTEIKYLFVDIGGVLLTDGWSQDSRKLAVKEFGLNPEEMEKRHSQVFETYEEGKFTIRENLNRVVFYEQRTFTQARFRKFMFTRSEPYPKMIKLIRRLREKYGLKVIVVSNEARELNAYRIRKFNLNGFVDSFIVLNTSQAPARQVVYIENTPMFVRIAEGLGIRSILHVDYEPTCAKLASFGLEFAE
jgi:putative hydrolase of the HAD superfamily